MSRAARKTRERRNSSLTTSACVEFRLARDASTSESPRLSHTHTARGARRSSMSLATIGGVSPAPRRAVALARRARAPQTCRRALPLFASADQTPSSPGESAAASNPFPVFRKMAGSWTDSVRHVAADMQETPLRLLGTRTVTLPGDDTVLLRSSTEFPNGKTLNLAFVGRRVDEAHGLKDIVRFDRVALPGEEAKPEGYFPIVLLASEHPARGPEDFDVVVVREVLADEGRTLLTETVTLVEGGLEACHVAQELTESGGLGGVQLWRSRWSKGAAREGEKS